MEQLKKPLLNVGQFIWSLVLSIMKHDIASLAAMISFYALFSMFPLIVLIIYGASVFIPHYHIEKLLLDALSPYYPALPEAKKFIGFYVAHLAATGAKVGVVSAVTLIWSATSGFIAVQQAMDVIWDIHIHEQRSFLSRRLIAFSMLMIMLILALVSYLIMGIYGVMPHRVYISTHVLHWVPHVLSVSRVLFPVSLFITCFIFYRYLPSRTMETSFALVGAFIAAIVLDLARWVFTWYASHLVEYQELYGGLAVVMLLILWMYIASIMMLFGAEVAAGLRSTFRNTESP